MSDEFNTRRAKVRQEFGYTDADGRQQTIKADADGLITPASPAEQAVLDAFEIPFARVTKPAKVASKGSEPPPEEEE